MRIVEGSMRRPVTVTMVTLAAVLFGMVALSRLPLNLLPEISYPTLTVRTEYTDSAPAEVEKLITEPLEEAVSVIQGLRHLRSSSRPGVSEITLEFAWKTNMDYAALDVREKIDLVDLPEDAENPVLLRYDPSLDPILRIGLYGDKDLVTLRYLADRVLKKDLESLEGVASVRAHGGLEEEIHVDVDEGKLATLGIPISAVSRFLEAQNVNAAGGRLRDRDAEFLVRTVNEFESLDDIGAATLYEDAGRRVRLKDVATVSRGHKEREIISRVQGKEAVELAVYKEGNANTVHVARDVKHRLAWLDEALPAGVHTRVLFDQSTFIEQSLAEVRSNALLGGLLAVFVLYLFLRERRSTLIVALIIPISVVATFFIMQQLGVSLNIMSLGGLALGVGMLVDNAIVVLEAITRQRQEGKSLWDATRDGANEVSRAVTASTLTTVAVFLPIIFVEGIAGQIFRDQALTVTSSLLVSLVAALTLIPVLGTLGERRRQAAAALEGGEGPATGAPSGDRPGPGGVIPPPGSAPASDGTPRRGVPAGGPAAAPVPGHLRRILRAVGRVIFFPFKLTFRGLRFLLVWGGRIFAMLLPGLALKGIRLVARLLAGLLGLLLRPIQAVFDRAWAALAAAYPRLLQAALGHRARTLGAAGVLAAAALLLIPQLGVELVPPFSQGEFTFELELPPGTPLAVTERKVAALEADLVGDPRIATLFGVIGDSPELGSAAIERRENVAQLNLSIRDPGNRRQEMAVIEMVRERLAAHPEIRHTFRRPSYFSFKTPIEVHVFGHDLEALGSYSAALAQTMAQVPGLRDVRSSLEEGSPEVQISFRRERAADLDLDLESISRTLRNKIRGEVATRLKERDRQLDILVRTARASELEVAEVTDLIVGQAGGIPIPLSTVADVVVGMGPSQITRIGQQRAAIVRANLVGRDLGSASREIEALLRHHPPPPTLAASLGGQNKEISTSYRSLALAAFLAIFMVYLVMASQFESFLHPLVILFTVPLGGVGVVLALVLTKTAISIVVLIGVVMLTGIVVNNAIVLIDFINQRRRAGLAKIDAIIEGAQARLRPIFMTTLTTVLALLPMALGLGQGAELRAPLAVAVIGGLTLGTLLTLVVIPVVYATLDRNP
ncbi:MAG: efflux RND transporter permease subunit [Candidatus Eisenbacteria sp.]|nr:efflux RND transporter permease subunit [Candidatus Eisenbacteria bacterium]